MLLLRRALCLLFLALIGPYSVGAAPAAPPGTPVELHAAPPSILVKLRAEGPHAVTDCAEARSRRAEPLAPATADGSDSLDRLQRRLGVRAVRAVFRSSHSDQPESFARRRQKLRAALRAAAARRAAPVDPPDLAHVYRMELPPSADTRGAAALFRADPHVEWAQPNYPVDADRLLDDPFLHSEGTWFQAYPDQWGVHAIDAPSAWDVSLGEGVVIGVVDTGVDLAHPDLAENLWLNPGETPNGRDDDGNGFVDDLHGYDFHDDDPDPQDENGHGTHVAGIAAARGDNGLGIAGVAPRATILPVRVFPPIGSAETDVVWRGVLYAVMNGADVVNGSFSCGTVCRSNPIAEEVLGFAAALGIAFVTSAGNAASDVMLKSPERLREAIVVGSIQPSRELASSSSFGFLVDVVAPGEEVLSLAASAAPEFWARFRFVGGGDYMRLSGTSMAAPHVSGVLALLLAADPALTAEDLRARIRASAVDLGEPGHDRRFGAGLVAPAAALQEPPLDARGAILSPLPGDTLDTDADEVPVIGSVEGADVAGYQLEIGAGSMPELWTPLPGAPPPPFSAREIAVLPLAELPDGAYVLRLTLTAHDGRQLREFTPIGVDRNRPVFLSSPDHEARNPDIHGRRVAWESPRTREGGDSDLDLFVGTFAEEGGEELVTGPGDQREVALSLGQVAWLDGSPLDDVQVRSCRTRDRAPCIGMDVTQGPGVRFRPQLSTTHLVYQEFSEEEAKLAGCRLAGDGSCAPQRIAPGTRIPLSPALGGSRIAWGAFPATFQGEIFLCSLAGGPERCTPTLLETDAGAPEPRALDGSLLAYVDVGSDGALHLCELGSSDDMCLSDRKLATGVDAADLSRHRVVWDAEGSHGERDVYFCEYDPRTRRCPAQPITRDPARQAKPRIDGTRVVWEDDRSGITRIASFELPALASLGDRVARPGQWIAVPLRTLDPSVPVRFSASLVGGGEIATRGGELVQLGPSHALFLWRPGPDATGSHEIAFRASLRSGLYSEEVVRIEVQRRGAGGDR